MQHPLNCTLVISDYQIKFLGSAIVAARGKSGGLALFWKEGLDVEIILKSSHVITGPIIQDILQIPIRHNSMEDSLKWNGSHNGRIELTGIGTNGSISWSHGVLVISSLDNLIFLMWKDLLSRPQGNAHYQISDGRVDVVVDPGIVFIASDAAFDIGSGQGAVGVFSFACFHLENSIICRFQYGEHLISYDIVDYCPAQNYIVKRDLKKTLHFLRWF
ncbi:hypothetical protein FRX31_026552 [Thalictrum thalictroides]|uniref:Uncharacterized protein n=1 Tax=Thalictrum thalictroides TaxID=46969 RepID=A0A7J6VI22_THATH|nr:hypothetical protein FRX31_026552 [Thalictrum thalictroides]